MVDYDFYLNSYLGTAIPEKAFAGAAAKAAAALDRLTRMYQVAHTDGVSVKMALCAMAEVIYGQKQEGLTAATVGGVSVRYEKTDDLRRRLLQQAGIYLDIYRGVSP